MSAKKLRLVLGGFVILVLTACLKPSREPGSVTPGGNNNSGGVNLDNAPLTYNGFVQLFMQEYCLACHTRGAPGFFEPNLDNYDDVVLFTPDNIDAMQGITTKMPPSGEIPLNRIDRYQDWYDAGTPEN